MIKEFFLRTRRYLWKEINRLNQHAEILTAEKNKLEEDVKHLKEFIQANENMLLFPTISRLDIDELLSLFKQDYFREFRLHPFVREGLSLIANRQLILDQDEQLDEYLQSDALNLVFQKFGSDKGVRHNYGGIYQCLIGQNSKPTILEIGIGSENNFMYANGSSGGSLKAWREFYPNGIVIGADIDLDSVNNVGMPAFVVDQTSESSLTNLISQLKEFPSFDFVIEDGFHDLHANIRTLIHVLPLLKSGGYYVIEDIHESMIDLWTLIGGYLKLDLKVFDLRRYKPNVNDNILVVIKKS